MWDFNCALGLWASGLPAPHAAMLLRTLSVLDEWPCMIGALDGAAAHPTKLRRRCDRSLDSFMEWSKRGTQLFAGTVLMAALSTIAVALRFFSRGRILRVLGPTDWFLALTLVGTPAFPRRPVSVPVLMRTMAHTSRSATQFFCIGNTASVGVPISAYQVQYVAILINNLSLVLTKVSVCLLFLDVFLVTSVRKATYVVLVAVILHGTYVTLTNIFFCTPIHNYWDKPFNNNCIDIRVKFNVDNGLNILINFVTLCLPVPAIWPMTLPWRQKLWLLVLFILGFG
ncbi:predicted protein [Chaetomium globosum CBS 148.51]|uniref:Rhodopsin domain-containing protein n=1 Tax=Chaetomium globosum (strain ATCC 6205 / CBS 148.51 / DSM 1962 / NBRC 6347 / NRRL 1970) TaxID=306901 RepID=Q2GU26_CHAGB|nr:uncharacterized protein CHGG_08528 [Chaetomium globosum CBS 148.51]EAQ84514.1 predicted protein [Chaetomium globosum CBS 148.51]